jgi:hypothetical protein
MKIIDRAYYIINNKIRTRKEQKDKKERLRK